MNAEAKVRAEDGSRRVEQEHGHWQAVLKYLFFLPNFFSHENILLVYSKDKNSFFFGKTHFCRSQRHSFIPKPCIWRKWLFCLDLCNWSLITHCILIPNLWLKIRILTHSCSKPLAQKIEKIEFFVLIAQKQQVKHEKSTFYCVSFLLAKGTLCCKKAARIGNYISRWA